jgi:hypothetical protein
MPSPSARPQNAWKEWDSERRVAGVQGAGPAPQRRVAAGPVPTSTAVDQLLRARLAALERAEARLAAGSYGRSVRSGQPIPDERLEADPLAELTVQEAAAAERSILEEDEGAVGLVSADHPFEVLADAGITPEEAQASEEDDDEPAPEPSLGIHIEPHNQAR